MAPRALHNRAPETPALTRNQQEILSCLRAAKQPLGAYAILDRVRGAGIAAPTTVYRALNDLIGFGLVHRLESWNAFVACEHQAHSEQTAFAICRECRKVVEIELRADQLSVLCSFAPKDIAIERITLEFGGLCAGCRSARTRPAPSLSAGSS